MATLTIEIDDDEIKGFEPIGYGDIQVGDYYLGKNKNEEFYVEKSDKYMSGPWILLKKTKSYRPFNIEEIFRHMVNETEFTHNRAGKSSAIYCIAKNSITFTPTPVCGSYSSITSNDLLEFYQVGKSPAGVIDREV